MNQQRAESYLDAEELMHLALAASRENKNEDAIVYFKRALELAPNDAGLHYLLGALYLRIGLHQRAAGYMGRALALDPELDGARFQLGSIYWAHGQLDAAAETWKRFDEYGADHPLSLFKTGLLHLARKEFDAGEDCLRRGIKANRVDAALNHDMAQVLSQVQSYRAAPTANSGQETPVPPTPTSTVPKKPATPPPRPETPTKPDTAAKTPTSAKTGAAAKTESEPARPKAPKSVLVSAYRQNKLQDGDE